MYYKARITFSEFGKNFACEIWNPGLWNPEYSLRNPESQELLESRIQVPVTGIQYLESRIHGAESRFQDCLTFPYMGLDVRRMRKIIDAAPQLDNGSDIITAFYLFI